MRDDKYILFGLTLCCLFGMGLPGNVTVQGFYHDFAFIFAGCLCGIIRGEHQTTQSVEKEKKNNDV